MKFLARHDTAAELFMPHKHPQRKTTNSKHGLMLIYDTDFSSIPHIIYLHFMSRYILFADDLPDDVGKDTDSS